MLVFMIRFHFYTDKNATELHSVNHQGVCPGDTVHIGCVARNTSIIRWISSALFEGNDFLCHRDDVTSRNTTVNGLALVLDKDTPSDSNGLQTLMCNLTFQVTRNSINHISDSFSITCQNLDLGIGVNTTFQLARRFI